MRSNKISLNSAKTEIVLFRPTYKKEIKKKLNFRLSGQKLELSDKVIYLGVTLDEHLSWKTHIKKTLLKLSRAIGLLAKIRHYVPKETLKNIYYALFHSHLQYAAIVWGQDKSQLAMKIQTLQNKALRIINFKNTRDSANPLFLESKILKFDDVVKLQSCLLAYSFAHKTLPTALNSLFTPTQDVHNHNTKFAELKLFVSQTNTAKYVSNSIQNKVVKTWNEVLNQINDHPFITSKKKFKETLEDLFINTYKS